MSGPGPGGRGFALVTGASAGIGLEYCRQLAARGYDLMLVARDEVRLRSAAAELSIAHRIAADVVAADLSRDDDVARLVSWIETTPPLSLLVNNAGFGTTELFARTDPRRQEEMVRLHVLAPMRLCRAALPAMLAARRGGIINVSSVAAFVYSPGSANYCATKAYLNSFSEGLGVELAGTGVRVQAVCPGVTHSEFHQRMRETRHRPAYLWLTARSVVEASLRQLERGGPVICVPDWRYKLIVALLGLVPRRAIGLATGRV